MGAVQTVPLLEEYDTTVLGSDREKSLHVTYGLP
jgi:hypothetical protein